MCLTSGNIPDALRAATDRLAGFSDTARLDSELLMAHALDLSRGEMLMRHRDLSVPADFAALVARRAAGEPVAHIIGTRDFWTITLAVTPDTLIPRPDSETLIEAAVDHFGARGPQTVLDLGTGSGALLLAALAQWPQARGLGIDTSAAALAVARGNAARLDLGGRADFCIGDWAKGVKGAFDLLLINPPYIGVDEPLSGDVLREPASALFAGTDGLDDYRRIAPDLPRLIAPGGMAAIEIGHRQGESVGALVAAQGLNIAIRRDLAGLDRCIVATRT
ncbi:peptide chain release factor N(5)-glutamine methyltransferase [Sphingobium abikonense]|uniref:peptide chain release factor N(5)-glutamine methyltransferase n=1 Tax=Sphingobium abikonense TaxID=86193 RepID=UPI0007897F53|nr:peptide chain release factor N(5)-glutamine methyltransferase [Sphingobium abikonense]